MKWLPFCSAAADETKSKIFFFFFSLLEPKEMLLHIVHDHLYGYWSVSVSFIPDQWVKKSFLYLTQQSSFFRKTLKAFFRAALCFATIDRVHKQKLCLHIWHRVQDVWPDLTLMTMLRLLLQSLIFMELKSQHSRGLGSSLPGDTGCHVCCFPVVLSVWFPPTVISDVHWSSLQLSVA